VRTGPSPWATDRQIAVFRLRDGVIGAMGGVCPHAGACRPTCRWTRPGSCPPHNYTFPVADGTSPNGDFEVAVYPVREERGEVVVDL
jgi:nitrite reductase (NADH) small subunit